MKGTSNSRRKALLVGGGIASLAAAVYLIREGGFSGKNIQVLEQGEVPGGALDGSGDAERGFLIRGGRMFEAHFGCTWDLLSGIPTLDDPSKSVTEEVFDFSRRIVTSSKCRLVKGGERMDASSYGLSLKDRIDMLRLRLASEASLGARRIDEWFSPPFFKTVFWLLWSTTFAFSPGAASSRCGATSSASSTSSPASAAWRGSCGPSTTSTTRWSAPWRRGLKKRGWPSASGAG